MSREYTIKSVKKGNTWSSSYGEMQSYALALDGVGEPVQLNKKVPVKSEPREGDVLFGTLEEQERNGRVYFKFKVDNTQQNGGGFKSQPRDDAAIKAQFAIKAAISALGEFNSAEDYDSYMDAVEDAAKRFYSMVDKVKNS